MKTLTHELYAQDGVQVAGKLSIAYSWDVLMQDGGVYSSTPKTHYSADGVFSVPILAADDPGIEPGYEGFTTRVSWCAIAPDCNGRMAEGKITTKTLQVVLADPEPVSVADLDNVTPATMGGVWYGGGGGLDAEGIQDVVGAMIVAAGGTYDDEAGTITLPSTGGDTTVQIGTVTLPEDPTPGLSVSVLADSTTVLPEGVTWDSGGEPTITERMLLVFVWSGTDWVGTYGPSIPNAPVPPDETGPTAGTLGVVMDVTTADGTVTGAADETELDAAPYSFRIDAGSWSAWQVGNTYEWTGLTAETEYDFQHRVRDAAGNITEGAVVTDTTDPVPPDSTPPTPGTLAASAITSSGFTLTVTGASDDEALHGTPYRFSTDDGATYSAWQAGATFDATGLDPETEYTCVHQVRDAALNVATGSSIVVETNPDTPPATLSDAILALSPVGYWKLDETTGTTAIDYSGNSRDGTYGGTYTLNNRDGAPTFNSGYVEIADHDDWTIGTGMTVFAITYVNALTAGVQWVATKGAAGGYEWGFGVNQPADGSGLVGVQWTHGGSDIKRENGSSAFPAAGWHGVAAAFPDGPAGTRFPLYLDTGTPIASTTTSTAGSATNTTSPLRIAMRGPGGFQGPLAGAVRHVAIFRGALSSAQIGSLMAAASAEGLIP